MSPNCVLLPCSNASKIFGRVSGSIPSPVSAISYMQLFVRIIARRDVNLPVFGGKLHRVVDQVPKDLAVPVLDRRGDGPFPARPDQSEGVNALTISL